MEIRISTTRETEKRVRALGIFFLYYYYYYYYYMPVHYIRCFFQYFYYYDFFFSAFPPFETYLAIMLYACIRSALDVCPSNGHRGSRPQRDSGRGPSVCRDLRDFDALVIRA